MRITVLLMLFVSYSSYALDWYWIARKNNSNLSTNTQSVNMSTVNSSFSYHGYGGRIVVANNCPGGEEQSDLFWESDFFIIPKKLDAVSFDDGRRVTLNTVPATFQYVYRDDAAHWVFGNPYQWLGRPASLPMFCQQIGATDSATPGLSDVSATVSMDISGLEPGRYIIEYPGGVVFSQWASGQNVDTVVRASLPFMSDAAWAGSFVKAEIIVPNYCTGTAADINHGSLTPYDANGNISNSRVSLSCLKRGTSVKLNIIGGRTPNDTRYTINNGVTSLGAKLDSKLTFTDSGSNENTVSVTGTNNVAISSQLITSEGLSAGHFEGFSIIQITYD